MKVDRCDKPSQKPPMTTGAKTIGQIPPFVAKAEITEAERLRAMLKSLRAQVRRACVPHIEIEVDAATAVYVSDPTDGNFERLRAVHVDLAVAGSNLISPAFRAIVDHAVSSCEKRIRTFSKPIFERALDAARARLSEVETSEWRHFKEATGCEPPADPPPGQAHENQFSAPAKTWLDSNPVIGFARKTVSRIEALMAGSSTPDSILAFLREHAL